MAESFSKIGSPIKSGDSIWLGNTNASIVAENEFFGVNGYLKYWNGANWVLKPVKYWNGSTWVQKPVKYWTGSMWKLTDAGLINSFTYGLDMFAWSGTGSNNATISRDTITGKSPANGEPLKMAITGIDPHISTYNGAVWNIAPAVADQTWQVKVWAKASVATTGQIFIFGVDSAGNFISNGGAAYNAGSISIGTTWSEVKYSMTFFDTTVAYIQTRLDGPESGGTGINIWWDNLQVYRLS